ncbi:MAG: HNH endonuclease signature motif containing protein, partial [Kofleriaceae bacterium]
NTEQEGGTVLLDASIAADNTFAGTLETTCSAPSRGVSDWQSVDRALRAIARRKAALDAEEARWLREAEALQIWRQLGMVSALDYMERVLGYGPRAGQDRLRVARALGTLPRLTDALAIGALSFSAVREVTRVATPTTEQAWCDAAVGKNIRQVEELVADHQPGDRPDDPPCPQVRPRLVRFELSPETFAMLRQTHQVLDEEHGSRLSDDELIARLCSAVLDDASATEPTGRAKFQIAVTVCARCQQGWQDGAGTTVPIGPGAVERAYCDAQHIGSLDGAVPERAYQDVPPSVARFVRRRDGGRCRVPGCRSSRSLELHHVIHREHGGTHDALNLILACSSCHQAHHDGRLLISGDAEHLEVRRVVPAGAAGSRDDSATIRGGDEAPDLAAEACRGLIGLGWTAAVARPAVEAARAVVGEDAPLEPLIFEALRRCRRS